MKYGIRSKLIGVIGGLVIFTVAAIGISTYMNSSKIVKDNFVSANYELNKEIANSVQKEFEGYMSGLKMVASNNNTRTIPTVGFDSWRQDVFKAYLTTFEQPFQIFIGLPDGRIFIEPYYKFDETYDPRQRGWYTGVDSTKADFWSGIYVDAVTGQFAVSAATPVTDGEGKQIGILGTSIKLDELSDKIASIKVGKEGYVFILDGAGNVVAHPNPDLRGKPLEVAEIQEAIKSNTDGTVYYDYINPDSGDIEPKYAVYQKVEGLNWYVMTSMYVSEITDQTSSLIWFTLGVALVVMILATVTGIFFAASLTKPIKAMLADMDQVAAGDMTVVSDVKTKDEIGELSDQFNKMVGNIRDLIQNATGVTDEVALAAQTLAAASEEASASSDEVAKTVGEIAEGATDQAHDAEAASILAVNLDDKFVQLKSNSNDIADNADSVRQVNAKGMAVVEDLRDKSKQNNAATQEIVVAINDLDQKSNDIGGILETIRSIAEQTNLLALNASIEAARAGEHGRGFAVVADEIRKLAEESSSSAEKIQRIIQAIQEQTKSTVNIMDKFKENAGAQFKAVGDVNESFEEILNAVTEIVSQIEGINHFIGDMIEDKDNIVNAITNISSVSEETAAASQEVSASMDQQASAVESVAQSAERLNELSLELRKEIGKFKI